MDRQNREGGKTGSAHGLLTDADHHTHRRQRLVRLAMETIDLSKDPYVIRNHLGQWECVLCMTVHTNEGSYLSHTQAKKHQANLARRAAKEAAMAGGASHLNTSTVGPTTPIARQPSGKVPRVGRPHFTLKKLRDDLGRNGLLVHCRFPQAQGTPAFRVMSAFEQRLEAPNRSYQYLLIACEPYETIAFKVPNRPIVQDSELFYSYWDPDFKVFSVQLILDNK